MNRYLNLILLAAGNGERYGSNKLLTDINGKPMYRHIFDHLHHYYQDHVSDCEVTVVSQYEEILASAKAAGFSAVHNPSPEDGISLTIRLGLEAGIASSLERRVNNTGTNRHQGTGSVFFTADQPFVQYKTVEDFLIQACMADKGIVSASHSGVSGNPVFFDEIYYPELMDLTGDIGGKHVMNRHLDDVAWFEMSPEELTDIDLPGSGSNRIRDLSE